MAHKPTTKIRVDVDNGSFLVDKLQWDQWSQNYKAIYDRLMRDLEGDERIQQIIFGYDDMLQGYTIQAYTNRCTLYRTDLVFNDDHSNDREVTDKFLSSWLQLPIEESDKEQFEGIWKPRGKKIKFNRMWGNYRFSDEQCLALLAGEHVQFTSSNGKTLIGILDEQEFNGFRFFGFKLDGWAFPAEYNGHKFTEAEEQQLKAGKEILVTGLWSKKKNTRYDAYCTYSIKEGVRITRFQ